MSIHKEIQKRRTIAIISHPDAGKTTLTEKLLLFGGAIQIAGAVKSNKIKKTTTSDFLEIEKQRGISVTTSVMNFGYKGVKINLLDTPGHKDFAEDTYRTLTAVDSVLLVIDCQKGVEMQTEKLMNVCRMRKTPVIVFINKLDREGRNPTELLDEIEEKLGIKVRPLSWPVGMGSRFKGVYNIFENSFSFFKVNKQKVEHDVEKFTDLTSERLHELLNESADVLKHDIDLVNGVYGEFNTEEYLKGDAAPVFFGSALNNFGVRELLDTLIKIAPHPQGRDTTSGVIEPGSNKFSGFVFKIHSNLDPRHRDRIAFLRVCSGKLEKLKFYHHVRMNRKVRFANLATFMAQDKNAVEEAYPGDVVGLYDTGIFKIGDTITEGSQFMYKNIPTFSPEVFKELQLDDPFKSKQLEKGILQLTDEGLAQVFIQTMGNMKVVGTVGDLQFEVLQHRLLHEYGAACHFRPLNYFKACWLKYDSKADIDEMLKLRSFNLFYDKHKNLVFLPDSEYQLRYAKEANPKAEFMFTMEHNTETVEMENAV